MKKLYIIAGANGSGKTTFAKSFAQIHDLHFINADEIAKSLDPENITRHQVKAGRIFFRELNKRLGENNSFVIETTLSGKYLIDYIEKAKRNGFEIEMIYLFLERPEINIDRVKHRVLNGGHHVLEDDIIRRFHRSKKMFMNIYKDMVDHWIMYYNSDEISEKIATDEMIYDRKKWQEFIGDDDDKETD
jgi:predicted ABC-type ATPase